MNSATASIASRIVTRDYTRVYEGSQRADRAALEKSIAALQGLSLENLRKMKNAIQTRLNGALLTGGGKLSEEDRVFIRAVNGELAERRRRHQVPALFA